MVEPCCGLAYFPVYPHADELGENRMLNHEFRIAKVQKTLRWFEDDIPLLNTRVRELSKERQESARNFIAAMIAKTRAELERLEREQSNNGDDGSEYPCEAAD